MKQQRKQRVRGGSAVWAVAITSMAGFITALDNLIVTTALPSIPSARISAAASKTSNGQ
jgi:hypothetical protein